MAACLSNITEISREECIGNSLPIINDNFTNMKNYVCSLETGQQGIIQQLQFLVPLYGIINFYSDIVLGGVNFELDGKGKQNIVQGIDLRAFHLCNGNNGTPDLRDRFVVGSGGSYVHREFGPLYNSTASLAFSSVKLTIPEMPTHTHDIIEPSGGLGHNHGGATTVTGSKHKHKFDYEGAELDPNNDGSGNPQPDAQYQKFLNAETSEDGEHTHGIDYSTTGITINNKGGSVAHENRPPYMALAYIMRYI